MKQADQILSRLKLDKLTFIGSTDELLAWFFENRERLDMLARRDTARISQETNIPENLITTIIYSRSFIQSVFDELHFRHLSPTVLSDVYSTIIEQLKDSEVPLGAKRSVLEFMIRQMGLEKPRKLSVKQQNEVVVRIEPTRPTEVMEALGVFIEQNALPEPTPQNIIEAEIRRLDDVELDAGKD